MKKFEVSFVYTDYEDGEEPELNVVIVEAPDKATAERLVLEKFGMVEILYDTKEVV